MNAETKQSVETVLEPMPIQMDPERQHLKPERIQQTLARLLGWAEIEVAPGIHRARQFGSPTEAEAYVGFATRLAARRRQPVTIKLAGREVSLTLEGRPGRNKAGLLTDAVYSLACALG